VRAPVDNLDGTYTEFQGWADTSQIEVVAVSLNGDERLALRRAIKRVLQVNLEIFEALGLSDIELSLSDQEDYAKETQLFMTSASISCTCLSFVQITRPSLQSVTSTAIY
jgi:hypothetical protein